MFTIVAIGKLKEAYWRAAAEEYIMRLTPFLPVKMIEIPEEPLGAKPDRARVQKAEAVGIMKYLKPGARIVCLSPELKTDSSRGLADRVYGWRRRQEVIFVIGGPLGLHPSILEKADEKLSLSSLTFTHQMARVILLEQFYRAVMMEKNKYHY